MNGRAAVTRPDGQGMEVVEYQVPEPGPDGAEGTLGTFLLRYIGVFLS